MSDGERSLAELVQQMRKAQKRYFKERTQEALSASKRLEWEVDDAVKARLDPVKQPQLF